MIDHVDEDVFAMLGYNPPATRHEFNLPMRLLLQPVVEEEMSPTYEYCGILYYTKNCLLSTTSEESKKLSSIIHLKKKTTAGNIFTMLKY